MNPVRPRMHRDTPWAVPAVLDRSDPYAGDEVLAWEGEDDGPPESDDAAELRAWALARGIDLKRTHDLRSPDRLLVSLDDHDLVQIAEDWLPDIAMECLDRVLGPWADTNLPLAIRRAAAVTFAHAPLLEGGQSLIAKGADKRSRFPGRFRTSLRACVRVPLMVWTPAGPLLPLGSPWIPEVLPWSGLPAHCQGAPALVGRFVPGPEGHVLLGGLPLSIVPPVAPLLGAMDRVLLRIRARLPESTFEDALRWQGERLARTCFELQWEAGLEPWWGRPEAQSSG